ncbi:MAG: HAMP domain-containing sensor histidine kinase [Gammaproteobacteria bacterium]
MQTFNKLFRTLYAKLALVLLLLFCLVGGTFLFAALYSAQMYQQEVAQRLNRDLAMYIVDEHVLFRKGQINQTALKDLFHNLMIVNPSLELYLLAADGRILSYSASPDKVHRERVDLSPLASMLSGKATLPVLGDDPRHIGQQKAFSAAPITGDGDIQGYIYAILGSEQTDHITAMLKDSYIMRWSAVAVGTALLFALGAGLLIFALLTRRLGTLSRSMEVFKQQNFSAAVSYSVKNDAASDEIDRLSNTFFEMATHIRAQMERLRETDSLRRELVANVSHDLRTPLASLNGYLETLMLKDNSLTASERREYLETASRHADRLTKLVYDLFELAKLDAHELTPEREPFLLTELIQDVIQKFKLRAQQANVMIEADDAPDIPFVDADIGMIERVLDNLIDNALQHTPSGGSIHLSMETRDSQVTVKVRDTGSGISADVLPHIFDRFYRKAATDDNRDGAGLGLAIAQRIIEIHGGKLSVSSMINSGSEFNFSLPAKY